MHHCLILFCSCAQGPYTSSRFSAEMLTRARLADEARALAEARARSQAEAKRASMLARLERARKLRAERARAEEHALKAGIRAGRLTVSLAEAVVGPPLSSAHGDMATGTEIFGALGRFYVTVQLESLELLSEVADGPDPVFQDQFTIPVLQSTALLIQVCLNKAAFFLWRNTIHCKSGV
jgi:hypothetical protein